MNKIIAVLKGAPTVDLPKFVAADLQRIPTSAPEKVDITTVFQDVSILRNRLENLVKRTQQEVSAVKEDVKELYSRTDDLRAGKPGTCSAPNRATATVENITSPSAFVIDHRQTKSPSSSFSDDQQTSSPPALDRARATQANRHDDKAFPPPTKTHNPVHPLRLDKKDDTQSTTKPLYASQAAKPPSRIVGTSSANNSKNKLKVGIRNRDVYVGGLDPETKPYQVIDYVSKKLGISVPCEQLRTRSTTYSSFKITVDKNHIERVFNPNLWPADVIIDFYRRPRPRTDRWRPSNQYDDGPEPRNSRRNDDEHYERKYREQVYEDSDFNGYIYTGRSDTRYRRESNGE